MDKKSAPLTSSNVFTNDLLTINDLAWNNYKYLVKDGIFMSKNVAILKAKLRVFDYFFMPHPYKNRYHDELLFLESELESAKVDLHTEIERNKRAKKIRKIAIPGSIILSTIIGFVGGFRLRSNIN